MVEPYVLVFGRARSPSSVNPPLSDQQAQEIVEIAVEFHEIGLAIHDPATAAFLVNEKDLKALLEDDSGDFLGLQFSEERPQEGNVVLFELVGSHFDRRLTPTKVCKLVQKKLELEIEFLANEPEKNSIVSSSTSPLWKFGCKSQEAMEKLSSNEFGILKTNFRFVPVNLLQSSRTIGNVFPSPFSSSPPTPSLNPPSTFAPTSSSIALQSNAKKEKMVLVREVKRAVGYLLEKLVGFPKIETELELPPSVMLVLDDPKEGGMASLYLKEGEEGEQFTKAEISGMCQRIQNYLDRVREDRLLVPGCSRVVLMGDIELEKLTKVITRLMKIYCWD